MNQTEEINICQDFDDIIYWQHFIRSFKIILDKLETPIENKDELIEIITKIHNNQPINIKEETLLRKLLSNDSFNKKANSFIKHIIFKFENNIVSTIPNLKSDFFMLSKIMLDINPILKKLQENKESLIDLNTLKDIFKTNWIYDMIESSQIAFLNDFRIKKWDSYKLPDRKQFIDDLNKLKEKIKLEQNKYITNDNRIKSLFYQPNWDRITIKRLSDYILNKIGTENTKRYISENLADILNSVKDLDEDSPLNINDHETQVIWKIWNHIIIRIINNYMVINKDSWQVINKIENIQLSWKAIKIVWELFWEFTDIITWKKWYLRISDLNPTYKSSFEQISSIRTFWLHNRRSFFIWFSMVRSNKWQDLCTIIDPFRQKILWEVECWLLKDEYIIINKKDGKFKTSESKKLEKNNQCYDILIKIENKKWLFSYLSLRTWKYICSDEKKLKWAKCKDWSTLKINRWLGKSKKINLEDFYNNKNK